MKIYADPGGHISVKLREGASVVQKKADVILDLNTRGNWIRGIEILGGLLDFSLAEALKPFNPQRPRLGNDRDTLSLTVTYDQEVNASYIYLPQGTRFQTLSDSERRKVMEYSHSITPIATVSLDGSGGLLSLSFPTADGIGLLEDFLYFFDVSPQ